MTLNSLPPQFPFEQLNALDKYKVAGFFRRFVESYYEEYHLGHFVLAAYASVPALLTPDLLYKLWQNFHKYTWAEQEHRIHRIAVADLLLSSLCRELGHNLYEIHEPVRAAFSIWLQKTPRNADFDVEKPERIARFIHEYHAQSNPGANQWGAGYLIPQQRDALAYIEPTKAQEIMLTALQDAVKNQKESAIVQALSNITALNRRIDVIYRQDDKNAAYSFQQTAKLADAYKSLLQRNEAGFLQKITDDVRLKQLISSEDAGMGLAFSMGSTLVAEVDKEEKSTLYAFIIGVAESPDTSWQKLNGVASDCESLSNFVEDFFAENKVNLVKTILRDNQATYLSVKNAFSNLSLKHGDALLIYFSGRNLPTEEGRGLVLYDSVVPKANEVDDLAQNILIQKELEEILFAYLQQNNVHATLIIDTCLKSKEEAYQKFLQNNLRTRSSELKGSCVVLNASSLGEDAKEIFIGDGPKGVFTYALLEELKQNRAVDYTTLMQITRNKVQKAIADQHPFVEAFPPSAAYYQFLTGKPGKDIFSIQYDKDNGLWQVSAGKKHGITPSAGNIPTLIRTNQGVEFWVDTVADTFSWLRSSTADLPRDKVHECILIQKAPEKIRIGFLENSAVWKSMGARFTGPGQYDYFVPALPGQQADLYVGNDFLLGKTPDITAKTATKLATTRLVFEELVERLNRVGRYYMLQKVEGRPVNIKDSYELQLEKIEGQKFDRTTIDQAKAELVKDETLYVRYQMINGELVAPAFRCSLKWKGRSEGNKVYMYAFLFDEDTYEVQLLHSNETIVSPPTRGVGFGRSSERNNLVIMSHSLRTIPLQIPAETKLEGSGALHIMLSYTPIDYHVFEQSGIENYNFRTGFGTSGSIYGEWDTIKIPIKITRPDVKLRSALEIPTTERPFYKNHVLAIAVNQYTSIAPLPYSIQDAQSLINILTQRYDVESEKVYSLFDKEATRENIYNLIGKIEKELTESDNLIVLFFGHYSQGENGGFWLPVDATREKEFDWIATDQIYQIFDRTPAKNIVFIADGFQAASIQQSNTSKQRYFITPQEVNQVSDGVVPGNSPFVKTLVEVLANNKNPLTIEDLYKQTAARLSVTSSASAKLTFRYLPGQSISENMFTLYPRIQPTVVSLLSWPTNLKVVLVEYDRREITLGTMIEQGIKVNADASGNPNFARINRLEDVLPGSEMSQTADFAVYHKADIRLWVITQELLELDYIESFLKQERQNGKIIIPIVPEGVAFRGTPLEGLPSLPNNRNNEVSDRAQREYLNHADLSSDNQWVRLKEVVMDNLEAILSDYPDSVKIFSSPKEARSDKPSGEVVSLPGYLPNWPPFDNPDDVPLNWYLDDAHTQLGRARDLVWELVQKGTTAPARIAHIDTGYNPDHPLLKPLPNLNHQLAKSFVNDENGPYDRRYEEGKGELGHGVATMSILAGWSLDPLYTGGNDLGYIGAMPFADILPLRIADRAVIFSDDAICAAIEYAISHRCEVIMIAMGGRPTADIAQVINNAYEAGIVMVAAAGNTFSQGLYSIIQNKLVWPARFERVIAACGVSHNQLPYDFEIQKNYVDKSLDLDQLGLIANTQINWGPEEHMHYALAAYAPNIPWAYNDPNIPLLKGGGGSSSTTPQIAAAAALYITKYRDVLIQKGYYGTWKAVEAVRQALYLSADKSYSDSKKYFGNGILKAAAALNVPVQDINNNMKAPEAEASAYGIGEAFDLFT